MDSTSSVPPHIHPPMAQVPSAIRELMRFVQSMLMYSTIFAFLPFVRRPSRKSHPGARRLAPEEIEGHCRWQNAANRVRTISFGGANECAPLNRESDPR